MIIHSLDGYDSPSQPWRPSWGGLMWENCNAFPSGRCVGPGDRSSASIIYAGEEGSQGRHRIPLFNGRPGFILRPTETAVLCAYAADGGSQGANCHPPGVRHIHIHMHTHVHICMYIYIYRRKLPSAGGERPVPAGL